jgi:hypothetical protein
VIRRNSLRDLDNDRRITLKWILKTNRLGNCEQDLYDGGQWPVAAVVNAVMTSRAHKRVGIV